MKRVVTREGKIKEASIIEESILQHQIIDYFCAQSSILEDPKLKYLIVIHCVDNSHAIFEGYLSDNERLKFLGWFMRLFKVTRLEDLINLDVSVTFDTNFTRVLQVINNNSHENLELNYEVVPTKFLCEIEIKG